MSIPPSATLCPYCGQTQPADARRCEECGGYFDDLSRQATQQHMGPWFVRDPQSPFRPGCSYQVLLKQIQRGKVTLDTVLRGPTTRQYWTLARRAPGVAHHLGACHACEAVVTPGSKRCPACGTSFPEVNDRQSLGLDPVPTPAISATPLTAGAAPTAARAKVVATTSLGATAPAAAGQSDPGARRSNIEWLTGGDAAPAPAASSAAPNPRTDARFAAAMAAPAAPDTAPLPVAAASTPPLVWALIVLSALSIIAVIVVFAMMVLRPPAPATPDESPTAPPEQAQPSPSPATVPGAPIQPPAATPASPSNGAAATGATPPGSPGAPNFFGIEATPAAKRSASAAPSPAASSTPESGSPPELIEIDRLYRAGQIAEALTKLKALKPNPPVGVTAAHIDSLIERLETELANQKLREFFDAM